MSATTQSNSFSLSHKGSALLKIPSPSLFPPPGLSTAKIAAYFPLQLPTYSFSNTLTPTTSIPLSTSRFPVGLRTPPLESSHARQRHAVELLRYIARVDTLRALRHPSLPPTSSPKPSIRNERVAWPNFWKRRLRRVWSSRRWVGGGEMINGIHMMCRGRKCL
jgi:hypothetical protein